MVNKTEFGYVESHGANKNRTYIIKKYPPLIPMARNFDYILLLTE